MRILAVDTCSKTAAVSFVDNGNVISSFSFSTDTHSTTLLPCINSMLEYIGKSIYDVDLFAVTVGPGSFTGVRIGVATVKGFAFANNVPCVGVSTLWGMAENLKGVKGIVVPVMDARREMVYAALFESDECGNLTRLTDDCQIAVLDLCDILKKYKDIPVYFTGDAYNMFGENDILPAKKAYTPLGLRKPTAPGIASAAEMLWNSTEDKSIFTDVNLNPVYLKKTQAEREREESLQNKKQEI